MAGVIEEIRVRLYNPETRLAMIKLPSDHSDLVRSVITLLIKVYGEPIVAAVISSNGSARTARKFAALREIQSLFQVGVAVAGPSRGAGAIMKN